MHKEGTQDLCSDLDIRYYYNSTTVLWRDMLLAQCLYRNVFQLAPQPRQSDYWLFTNSSRAWNSTGWKCRISISRVVTQQLMCTRLTCQEQFTNFSEFLELCHLILMNNTWTVHDRSLPYRAIWRIKRWKASSATWININIPVIAKLYFCTGKMW